jgi:hypothetical protein
MLNKSRACLLPGPSKDLSERPRWNVTWFCSCLSSVFFLPCYVWTSSTEFHLDVDVIISYIMLPIILCVDSSINILHVLLSSQNNKYNF